MIPKVKSTSQRGHRAAWTTTVLLLGLLMVLPAASSAQESCPNAQFRVGFSAALPDCRAYELVTPANSHGIRPRATPNDLGSNMFDAPVIADSGESVLFQTVGGVLPGVGGGNGGGGNGFTDRYVADRVDGEGWVSRRIGPDGTETETPWIGASAVDREHYFLQAGASAFRQDRGSLLVFGPWTPVVYLHNPDGSFEMVGQGTLGQDPTPTGLYITPTADHVFFASSAHLEPDTHSTAQAIYDRPPGGPTTVVSLLPGEVTPPGGAGDADWKGASEDGRLVAFKFSSNPDLYVRVDGDETKTVTSTANTFGGIFGGRVFYGDASTPSAVAAAQTPADLFFYEPATESTTQITDVGDARFVNVSADGTSVYFISHSQIDGEGVAGQPNLYRWVESGGTSFVATVATADETADLHPESSIGAAQNMTAWTQAIRGDVKQMTQGRATALNRSTADGSVLTFEAVAQLTPFDNAGHRQVYRYDADADQIDCVSCEPGAGPATGDAQLQSTMYLSTEDIYTPLGAVHPTRSLTDDGETVFFESDAPLLARDTNGTQDVYRWTGEVGADLITTGKSRGKSYLYGVSPDGSDVVFLTEQPLLPEDQNAGTGTLYDARVGGGFLSGGGAGSDGCVEDACQGTPAAPPAGSTTGSLSFSGPGNSAGARPPQQGGKKKRSCKRFKSKRKRRKCRRARSRGSAEKRSCKRTGGKRRKCRRAKGAKRRGEAAGRRAK